MYIMNAVSVAFCLKVGREVVGVVRLVYDCGTQVHPELVLCDIGGRCGQSRADRGEIYPDDRNAVGLQTLRLAPYGWSSIVPMVVARPLVVAPRRRYPCYHSETIVGVGGASELSCHTPAFRH